MYEPEEQWKQVDAYMAQKLIAPDPVLEAALQRNSEAGLPNHDVAVNQGKLLNLFAQMCGAKTVLEIGTLGGYSTIWLARALPEGGKVITLEYSAKHAGIAQQNIDAAGVADKVEIIVGAAAESLPHLQDRAPFDLIFIDADKPNNPVYLEWALKLSRKGTVIIGDNVVRNGAVTDPQSADANVIGVRRFVDMMGAEPRLDATALQTVGSKGWDGFTLAIVQ
jgi:predicted O-methyltransferase YrrM